VSQRPRKALRYGIVALGLLALVGALVAIKLAQIGSLIAMGEEYEKSGPPPEAVGSSRVVAESWEGVLSAVGSVAGARSVELANDAAGRVRKIRFESGQVVKQGQVLVELDASVERAQLASLRSRRDLAEVTAKRSRALVKENVLAQAQLDNDETTLRTANTDIAALQAQIERKIVRAPFGGRLGIRQVDVGQYLNPGTTLTVLEATGAVFVDFTLPQRELGRIREGMTVRIQPGAAAKPTEGMIVAVDPTLDDATRSLKIRASVENMGEALRPGMFVDVSVVLPRRDEVIIVPATAVVHASYGDSVFVIEDKPADSPGMRETPDGKPVKMARQQFVRLGEARGDFVAIAEGLKAGQEVVSVGAFKLRNKAPIVIDNTVKPDPKLDPRPENR
jgi:membrane fusion protein (multidrug efflux system)